MSFSQGYLAGYTLQSNLNNRREQIKNQREQLDLLKKQQDFNLAKQGYYQDPNGNFAPIPGSLPDMTNKIISHMSNSLQEIYNQQARKDTTQAIINTCRANGDVRELDRCIKNNPYVKNLAESVGLSQITPLNFNDPEDIKLLQELGIPEEITKDQKKAEALSKIFFKSYDQEENKWKANGLECLMVSTNFSQNASRKDFEESARFLDTIYKTIKGSLPIEINNSEQPEYKPTTIEKNSAAARNVISEIKNNFGNEDWTNPDVRKNLYPYLKELENLTGDKFSEQENKTLIEIHSILREAEEAKLMGLTQTGPLSSFFNKIKDYVKENPTEGIEPNIAFQTIRNIIIHSLAGSAMSDRELEIMDKMIRSSGKKLGPVLVSLKNIVRLNQSKLQAISYNHHPYIFQYHAGTDLDTSKNIMDYLDKKIALLNGQSPNKNNKRKPLEEIFNFNE